MRNDPDELRNLANEPAHAKTLADLKQQLASLKTALKDEDQFANEQPKDGVDGAAADRPALGRMTVPQAIASAGGQR